MNEEQKHNLAWLEAEARKQDEVAADHDRQHEELMHKWLDVELESLADAVVEEITSLAAALAELDLIDEENQGTPRQVRRPDGEMDVSIEVDQPEPRLYAFGPGGALMATRMLPGGRLEHALLDEHGTPITWHKGPAGKARPEEN
ncbi:MAG: hypothetical protein WBQ41_15265 [Solirubrobacterales bacterium]